MFTVRPPIAARRFCILLLSLTLVCGCRSESEPQDSIATTSAEATSENPTQKVVTELNDANTPVGTAKGKVALPDWAASTADVAASGTASAQPEVSSTDQINQPAQKPAAPPVAPTPTKQQLDQWQLQDHEPLTLVASVHFKQMGFTQRIVPLPDSRQYLLGGGTITLWTLGANEPDATLVDWRQEENVEFLDIAVAPSGKWFAAINSAGSILIYDLVDRQERVFKKIHHSLVPSVDISPDSQLVATAGYNGQVTVWNAADLSEKQKIEEDSRGIKDFLFLSPDRLVTAAEKTTVWDVQAGTKIQNLEGDRYYTSLSLSPSGQYFTYGGSKGLKVCRTSDFQTVSMLPSNLGLDESIIWRDDKTLASVSGNAIRLWHVPSRQMFQVIDNRGTQLAGACWLPEHKVLAVGSLLRRTRFWATSSAADALGLTTSQPVIPLPAEPAQKPAAAFEFANVINLRSFPRLPDAIAQLEMDYMVQYTTASPVDDAILFCRYLLHQAGWQEVAAASPSPGYMTFKKQGFQLDCSVTELANQGTSVSMTSLGNFDMRMAGQPSGLVEPLYQSARTSMLVSKSDLLTLELDVLKSMTDRGWAAYSRLSSSHSEQPDQRDLRFLLNSTELSVSISKNVTDPSAYNIQYTAFPVTNSIPLPPDCKFVEYNGSPELQLVASSHQSIDQLTEYFDAAMVEQHWLILPTDRQQVDDTLWLYYTRDQQDVVIGLRSLEDGWTRITAGDVASSGSFQLTASDKMPEESKDAAAGIQAADWPLMQSAREVQYQKLEKNVGFQVPSVSLEQFIKFYEQELSELGWSKKGRSMVEKEFCYADFEKDGVSITLRGNMRGDVATCSVQGDGLLWTKPLPAPKTVISYETWLRSTQKHASLDFLSQYEGEMRKLQEETAQQLKE